jgi:hypothetical protein
MDGNAVDMTKGQDRGRAVQRNLIWSELNTEESLLPESFSHTKIQTNSSR